MVHVGVSRMIYKKLSVQNMNRLSVVIKTYSPQRQGYCIHTFSFIKDKHTDIWTDRQTDGQTDGRKDRRTN